MKRVVLLLRVSTAGQAEDGYSLEFQKEKLLAYCKAKDYAVVGIYTENGYSGSNLKRPGIQRIIEEADKNKFDAVLVYKLDRLSRSQKDTMYMIEDIFIPNNIAFISLNESFDTSTQFGIAMVGILSVFAQLERANIKERTFDGRKGRAKEGKWHGGGDCHPIGYDYIDGELVVNEKEAEQVRMVYEYYASGLSITEIIRRMEGFTTKHGDWHHPGTVANVLDNPLYTGTVHFDGVLTPDSHKAIIPQELFDNVAAIRSGVHKYIKKDSKYLLSGLVYCKNCGARYFVKKNPNKNLFYCCHSRAKVNKLMVKDPTCKNKNWKKDELEKAVFDEIKKLAKNPHLLHKIKKAPSENTDGNQNQQVQGEIERTSNEINRLMDLYKANDSIIQVDEIAQQIDELYQRKVRLLQSIKPSIADEKYTITSFSVENAKLLIADLPAAIREGNTDIIRYSLLRLLDKIEVEGETLHFLWSFAE